MNRERERDTHTERHKNRHRKKNENTYIGINLTRPAIDKKNISYLSHNHFDLQDNPGRCNRPNSDHRKTIDYMYDPESLKVTTGVFK